MEKSKAVTLQEAIDTLLDLTTAPNEWAQELEAKKADLANIAYAIFGVLKIEAK